MAGTKLSDKEAAFLAAAKRDLTKSKADAATSNVPPAGVSEKSLTSNGVTSRAERTTHGTPSSAADTVAVASQVDKLFEEQDTQTLTQDERSFFQSFMGMVASVLKIMGSLSFAILVILGLILANAIGDDRRVDAVALLDRDFGCPKN